jgi:uncharacterized protein
MSNDGTPRFRVLRRAECEALLARNHVGRIAFAQGNRIDIIPLHYVFADGVLCARTAPETRLERTSQNFNDAWPAAFEVDEVEELFRWRSVVVHGNFHAAVEGDDEWLREKADWEKAAQAFRRLIPDAFTEKDPTRFRDVVIRVDVAEISGREAERPAPPGRRRPGKAAATSSRRRLRSRPGTSVKRG